MYSWIDIAIVIVLIFYAAEGYALGAIPAMFDLLQFAGSFIIGLQFYSVFVPIITRFVTMPLGIANAVSFFLLAFISEFFLHILFAIVLKKVMENSFLQKPNLQRMNKILGILPGFVSGVILVMFILTVVAALPVSPYLKQLLDNSPLANAFLAKSQRLEQQMGNIFGKAANDTLNFMTVEPKSNEMVKLNFTFKNGVPNLAVEQRMLQMVNAQREAHNIAPLVEDDALRAIARAHGEDMLARGYFSHYTPEGLSPFDRMDQAGIQYTAAGENLAFSPNLTLAMQGLMQSPGHRANILSKDFHKVGIGVIDAGIFGEMFVQDFTN